MKITKQTCVSHHQIVEIHETHHFRVQLEVGNIITLRVDSEDELITYIKGADKDSDKQWQKLKVTGRTEVTSLIEKALGKTL